MNLLFFLTPKSEVVYVTENDTMRQVLEKMDHCTYTAVPVIDEKGQYVSTITDGDLLREIEKNMPFDLKKATAIHLKDIPCMRDYHPVSVQSDMEDLMSKVINQNFVPVVDDKEIFIGIITRKDVIQYLHQKATGK